MKIAMISVREREESRKRVLEQFDCPVTVFTNDKEIGIENHTENVKNSLVFGLGDESLLFLEDDIEISSIFWDVIDILEGQPLSPVSLCVVSRRFEPAAIRRGNYEPGIYRLINRRVFYGSMAIYMKKEVVRKVLDDWIDGLYFDNQPALINEIYGFFPNPVQHLNQKRTWSKGRRYELVSATYE